MKYTATNERSSILVKSYKLNKYQTSNKKFHFLFIHTLQSPILTDMNISLKFYRTRWCKAFNYILIPRTNQMLQNF